MSDEDLQRVIAEITRDIRLAFAIAFWPPDVVQVFEREGVLVHYPGCGAVLTVPREAMRMVERAGFDIFGRRP